MSDDVCEKNQTLSSDMKGQLKVGFQSTQWVGQWVSQWVGQWVSSDRGQGRRRLTETELTVISVAPAQHVPVLSPGTSIHPRI